MIEVDKFIDFVIIPDRGYYSGIRAGFPASLNGKLLRVSISCMYITSNLDLATHWQFSLWESALEFERHDWKLRRAFVRLA